MDNFLIQTYGRLVFLVWFYMKAWFLFSLLVKRNDVADIAWGLGFLLVTLAAYLPQGIFLDRGLLVALLVTIWASRLSLHIYLRNRGRAEDYRYQAWRKEWGRAFYIRSYFQVFVLQGFLLLIVSSPAVVASVYRGTNWGILDLLGLFVWTVGFLFESVGDWQLARFIKNLENKERLIQQGLWQYTRHPNYFGEVAQWWGIWLIALSTPYGWLSIIGPFAITILILKVSGIPLLEKKMAENPEFEAYKKKTSIFIPLLPRS